MKTAVIIGVGPERGLGAYLCRAAAGEGLHVVVAGRTLAKLEEVAAGIVRAGGQATPVVCDTTREDQVVELIRQAESVGASPSWPLPAPPKGSTIPASPTSFA